jgi:hypothetical protein
MIAEAKPESRDGGSAAMIRRMEIPVDQTRPTFPMPGSQSAQQLESVAPAIVIPLSEREMVSLQ